MMINECSIELLQLAITGDLPPEREQALNRHLDQCEKCSTAIEQLAGGTAWCAEAAALLAGDDLDEAVPSREEWSEVDFTVEHLEPSDEPNVLGRLGGYDVLQVIGRGGMSVVLKAHDRELNRYVAIKVLAPHLAQSSLAKKRFIREAQAAAAVVHPHVIAIHQVQAQGRLPFLVMPLVAGESLAQRLAAQGRLELKETLRIGMQAAAGLSAAHEQGLVHRDVKPANILLEKGVERAVLTDFGLARAADDVSMTRWGMIAGTPQYMSPEQARGEPLDGRSDLFSLGCVLYEMATGVSPFRADSTLATLRRLIDDQPPALASLNPELPPWFVAIVDRLLEKDPARRFASAKQVSELLEGCLAHLQQPTNVPLPNVLISLRRDECITAERDEYDSNPKRQRGRFRAFLAYASGYYARKPFTKGTLAMLTLIGISLFAAGVVATNPPDISGQWSGENWGQVMLTQTAPGQYAGTYTDTALAGKGPGRIELNWSRIECRYNGTWSEGHDDRFGELSVHREENAIRGAFTTDRNSKINPATPHLSDLLWTPVGQAAKPGESKTAEFVPAAERFVVLLSQGEFDKATEDFDDTMKKALPPAKLKELWNGLAEVGGKFTGHGQPRTGNLFGYDIVYVPGNWEHNKLDFKVVFNKDGKIGGLWMVAPGTTTLPATPSKSAPTSGPTIERAKDEGNKVVIEGKAPAGARIAFHAGDNRGDGWSCGFPNAGRFTATLEKAWQGLNCRIVMESGDAILTLGGADRVGSAILSDGQLEFRAGQPSVARDGASTVAIGQWTAKSGEKVAINVTLSPPETGKPAEKANESRDIPTTVEKAVKVISTCAEGEPRVKEAIGSLKGLDQNKVVTELAKFLDSQSDTVRRAAVYILWKGEFQSIDPAVGGLLKLCNHEQDLTRGMAALALGANHVGRSLAALEKMTTDDKSGYARRCAAYALGLLGDPTATSILENALKDPESLVRANAKTALEMLGKAREQPSSEPAPNRTSRREFSRREINRLVRDFPEATDLSTPETACAAWQRASARKDAEAIHNLSWRQIDAAMIAKGYRDGEAQDPEAMAIYLKALAESKIIEVNLYRGELAMVTTYLPFPPGKGRDPYDARCFGRIGGQWKYLFVVLDRDGEDRLPGPVGARESFMEKMDRLWEEFRKIKKTRAAELGIDPIVTLDNLFGVDPLPELIKREIARQLHDAGADYDDLQVSVAEQRDSATPFVVKYKGLRHFKYTFDGKPDPHWPESANGQFIVSYIGGGQWQGKLGDTQFTAKVGHTDNIDLPFVNDPEVLGQWKAVDFVAKPDEFDPATPSWKDKLFFEGLTFLPKGKTSRPWFIWTKGVVIHRGDQTAGRYAIREIKGQKYLFMEWKNGDVMFRGQKPWYCVMAKVEGDAGTKSSDEVPAVTADSAKGLRLKCRPNKPQFSLGEQVWVTCSIANSTSATKPVPWSIGGGNHFALTPTSQPIGSGGLLPRALPRLGDEKYVMKDGYPPFTQKVLYLPPGKSVEFLLDCSHYDKPQKFEGRIVYDPVASRAWLPENYVDQLAVSNTFSFEVVARDSGSREQPARTTKGEVAATHPTDKSKISTDRIVVEDLALQMIVAIREKDDKKLRSLASDRIKAWPNALPVFAVELRERYRQNMGNEKFDLRASESLVEGDLAAVRCTGPKELQGKCLVLFFIKSGDGWLNCSLRASMENVPLSELLAKLRKQVDNKAAN